MDSPDTIHNTLVFGTLQDIHMLIESLGKPYVTEVFLQHPMKVYTKSMLSFITKFVLPVSKTFDDTLYLKTTPRRTR